jgi:outer membrane protein assembly factor BamB
MFIPRKLGSLAACALLSATLTGLAAPAESEAPKLIEQAGVQGGFIVHLGCGNGAFTSALRLNDRFQVQGLDPDAQTIAQARQAIRARGGYGPVCVDEHRGPLLPYIDNLVNLFVAEKLGDVPMKEVLRVLVPNGVAMIKQGNSWQKTVKPLDKGRDEWTHYYYNALGNATSKDTVVAPPDRLQWVGSPRWSRHHDRMSSLSAEVSAGGRLFYVLDEGSRISILLPPKWNLIARDAYNGVVLWKRPITQWNTHLWPLKSGPTELTRRLVAIGNRVYVTLGLRTPISVLDAATGETIQTLPETDGAEEILVAGKTLYALVNKNPWALDEFAVKLQSDQKRVETEFNWDEKPRSLMAFDLGTGQSLWRKDGKLVAPLTLATDGKRMVFHDGSRLVCLDAANGNESWASESAGRRKLYEYNYGPRLLLSGETVLYAGGDGSMLALDAPTGKELWNAPHEKSGYRSPEDLIVSGGLVWNAGTTQGGQTGEFKGRDPRSGEVKKSFLPDVPEGTYWFHHRCYIAKATERFLIPSRTGIEFVDTKSQHWDLNHWVRGACLYGVLPANGFTYAGPHNCACYPEAKLDGMNALSSGGSPHPAPLPDEQRLMRGPAYAADFTETKADPLDWPTYRHDNLRSGYTEQPLPANLGSTWELELGGPLSALTVADGRVYVSQIDEHTVHAVDRKTGEIRWSFIAGGRVDSPPTYWQGRLYFGSQDGRVYCVRAADGALVWRFQAAPNERHHFALEQVESVWPVHGSILVDQGAASFVCGRSVFLDGGLRFIKLDAATGRKLVEQVYNDVDPETGRDFQERHKTLQMPVGLSDILSSDGNWTYLRSQKIAADGTRVDIGPVSGDAIKQGYAQKGEEKHIFAPMGFLDDSWFHRSYWVYGKSFAGGHNGYFQAGKAAPAGRILVFDKENVYGYGREAKYYKWTTTMEHQLFAAKLDAADAVATPEGGPQGGRKRKPGPAGGNARLGNLAGTVSYPLSPKLDPSGKPFSVEAWVLLDGNTGLLLNDGGPLNGFSLALHEGKPEFHLRSAQTLYSAKAPSALGEGWHHLAALIDAAQQMHLFVDGKDVARSAGAFIASNPRNPLRLGGVNTYNNATPGESQPFTGLLDQLAIYSRALTADEILDRATIGDSSKAAAGAMLFSSFDKGDARDDGPGGLHGVAAAMDSGKGKSGAALWFRGTGPKRGGAAIASAPQPATVDPHQEANKSAGAAAAKGQPALVAHDWERYVPVVTRAMAMAGKSVLLSGPPDKLDEEYAFERLSQKDPAIQEDLAEQDAALEGQRGGTLSAVSTETGESSTDLELKSPPVWDGMAVAHGHLFISCVDGVLRCFGAPKQ